MSIKILEKSPPALYAAFDFFPSHKNAAIHINKFARALFEEMNGGVLYILETKNCPFIGSRKVSRSCGLIF